MAITMKLDANILNVLISQSRKTLTRYGITLIANPLIPELVKPNEFEEGVSHISCTFPLISNNIAAFVKLDFSESLQRYLRTEVCGITANTPPPKGEYEHEEVANFFMDFSNEIFEGSYSELSGTEEKIERAQTRLLLGPANLGFGDKKKLLFPLHSKQGVLFVKLILNNNE